MLNKRFGGMGFLFWSGLVLISDQFSKYLVQSFLVMGKSKVIIPNVLHFTFYMNPGAAFGILPYRNSFFITITVIVMAMIVYFYIQMPVNKPLVRTALALQFGGAGGNLIDRLINGHVVDFIDFRIWPIFNIADSAIVIGVILLVWEIIRWERGKGRKQ